MIFFPIIIFILGLVAGSFLYVVTTRSSVKTLLGRSNCPKCGATLHWYELIPVVSFLIQRGRCRTCSTRMTYNYIFAELLSGIFFVSVFCWASGYPLYIIFAIAIAMQVTMVLFWYDFRHYILPTWGLNILLLATTVIGVYTSGIIPTITGIVLVTAPLFALWGVSRGRWLGFGDVRLALCMGALLGTVNGLTAVMISFWIGAIVVILLLIIQRIWKGKLNRHSMVPFGPFLLLGMWLVFLFKISIWDILHYIQIVI